MIDVVDKKTRSRMMSGIRGKDTKPELMIRSGLHRLGFRFRLHYGQLPGKPDIVFPKYRAIVLINGCFWHGHDCHLFKWPSTREEFWREKITSNQLRDAKNREEFKNRKYKTMVIWECALKGRNRHDLSFVIGFTSDWLRSGSSDLEIRGDVPDQSKATQTKQENYE